MSWRSWLQWGLLFCLQGVMAEVHHWALPNGLHVWFVPDHRSPQVLTQIWYQVGSADEALGHTGISHMLEHMLFLGTKDHPKGAYDKTIADMGGYSNAMTSDDATVYYATVPVAGWEQVLALEADRMRNLVFDEGLFQRERKVVLEERRMRVEDNPSALALERYRASLFLSSPYHHMTIGWMHDIEGYTLEDCKRWYQKWYWPNHAHVVIVGDLSEQKVKEAVQRHFASLPSAPKEVQKVPQSAPQLSAIHQSMESVQVQVPSLYLGVVVPSFGSSNKIEEVYALRLLAAVLSEGHSARLDQVLKYQTEKVLGVGIYYNPFARFDTDFSVQLTPSGKVSDEALRLEVQREIAAIAKHGISDRALASAKAQVLSSHTYHLDDWESRAGLVGRVALLGKDEAFLDGLPNAFKSVTSDDIQAVAKRYFAQDRWVMFSLKPTKVEGRA